MSRERRAASAPQSTGCGDCLVFDVGNAEPENRGEGQEERIGERARREGTSDGTAGILVIAGGGLFVAMQVAI